MPKNLSRAEVETFRARLCAAAEKRFAKHGPDGVSLRQLAIDLGCSPMTPYRYFRDKNEILAAVRAAAFNQFAEALEGAAAGVPGDARGKSRAVRDAYLRFAFDRPDAYRLMFDLSHPAEDRHPELAEAVVRARRAMSAYVEGLVEQGVMAGDPQLLGYVFWAATHGVVMLHLAGMLTERPDVLTIQREAARLLARGARPADAPPS